MLLSRQAKKHIFGIFPPIAIDTDLTKIMQTIKVEGVNVNNIERLHKQIER